MIQTLFGSLEEPEKKSIFEQIRGQTGGIPPFAKSAKDGAPG
jgi:hypothetical protein